MSLQELREVDAGATTPSGPGAGSLTTAGLPPVPRSQDPGPGSPSARRLRLFVARRLAQAVVVLLLAYLISFLVVFVLPGDPIATIIDNGGNTVWVDPAQIEQLRAKYGLDQSLIQQLWTNFSAAVTGDLGVSARNGIATTTLIGDVAPYTLQLAGAALLIAVVLGAGLALLAYATRSRTLQTWLTALPAIGVAVPAFWIGLLLLQLFAYRLGWFPSIGNDGWRALVLPALTLALAPAAQIAQVLGANLYATLHDPLVVTARAKGASHSRVLLAHALPNSVVPAIALAGVIAGELLTGSVIVETVFAREGIGRLTVSAVEFRDIQVVQGVALLGAFVFVTVSLVCDVINAVIDPRTAEARTGAST